MRIKVAGLEGERDFIRFARGEVARAVGLDPASPFGQPTPCGLYVVALDGDRPVGMVETYLYDQCFSRLEEAYGSLLDPIRPVGLDELGNLRSIYTDPSHRRGGELFTAMFKAAAGLHHQLGARWGTCSTSADNLVLHRFYRKMGGRLMGTFRVGATEHVACLFELERLMAHPLLQAVPLEVEMSLPEMLAVRQRRWQMPPDNPEEAPTEAACP